MEWNKKIKKVVLLKVYKASKKLEKFLKNLTKKAYWSRKCDII